MEKEAPEDDRDDGNGDSEGAERQRSEQNKESEQTAALRFADSLRDAMRKV